MPRTPGGSSTDGPPTATAPTATAPPAAADAAVPAGAWVPARASAVELLGRAQNSGYREPPWLVRRADGQTIQLTPLLYAVLDAIDGGRGLAEIAQAAGRASGREVSADNVRVLIENRLVPLGLLRLPDGSEPELKKSDPLLGIRFRYTVTDPDRTNALTRPFAALFHPVIMIAVTAAFLAACWWVLFVKGLGSATHDAFANPGLLLLVLVVTVFSAGFHEFGHAAAARRGGATPGSMGAGLYLVWPAFYTDVTDSYRLGRGGRIRTDLGGLYFNAIVAVAIMAVWLATGWDALLLVVAIQVLQMVRQLLPLLRFDGYHILADLTGVPDLFQRIKPTLLGALPWRWGDPEANALRPWARIVVTLWVLVTVPLLILSVALMVLALPRIVGTAWASVLDQQERLAGAMPEGNWLGVIGHVAAIAVLLLPLLAIAAMLVLFVRGIGTRIIRGTRGRPVRRTAAIALAAVVAGAVAFAWWPDAHRYRPVQAYERGTLVDAVGAVTALGPAESEGLRRGAQGTTVTALPENTELGTAADPQLAMILVPREGSDAATWVFPFDRPLPPEADGNQALAVNTGNGSVVYDVAFALVWAEDDTVDTRNEAYAFASCTDCAAVAVGFQVVLIVGQADVVVPENLSAAVNYGCVNCLAYALASQLVVTLDGPLSEDAMARLSVLWEEIMLFAEDLESVPLSDIENQLEEYKALIVEVIEEDAATLAESDTRTGDDADPADETGTEGATPAPTADDEAPLQDAPEPTPTPTRTPTPEATASVDPQPSPTPTPTSTDQETAP